MVYSDEDTNSPLFSKPVMDGHLDDDHASWLEEIGFKSIVESYKAGQLVNETLLCKETLKHSLTKQQIRVIRKRVAALNWDTVRRNKDKYHPKIRHTWTTPSAIDQFPEANQGENGSRVLPHPLPGGARIDRRAALRHRIARENADDIFCNSTLAAYNDTLASSGNEGIVPLSFSPKLDLVASPPSPSLKYNIVPNAVLYVDHDENGSADRLDQRQDDGHHTISNAFVPDRRKAASADSINSSTNGDYAITQATPLGDSSTTCITPPTYYGDLSPPDLEGIQRLALIELTAILDAHGLRLASVSAAKIKAALRDRKRAMMAEPTTECAGAAPDPYSTTTALPPAILPADGGLEQCVENDRKYDPTRKVPLIFESMIRYLEKYGVHEEGILRVPGSLYRIKALVCGINENTREDLLSRLEKMGCNPNDVAALLKMFLRQLPNPLLTQKHILNFANVTKITNRSDQVSALNYLITLLPTVHNQTLKMLVRFLCQVVSHRDHNKMSAENVATIMAPNLFPRQFLTNHRPNPSTQVDQALECAAVMKLLLEHKEKLWIIPSQLITQLRVINETKKLAKRKSRSLNEMNGHTNGKDPSTTPNQNMIEKEILTHLVGQNPKIITASLNHLTTTADIIERCRKFLQMDPSRHLQLFEEGGNICERSLNTEYNLRQVISDNPFCHLILKEIPN